VSSLQASPPSSPIRAAYPTNLILLVLIILIIGLLVEVYNYEDSHYSVFCGLLTLTHLHTNIPVVEISTEMLQET
jgi:hypothetical protein